MRGATLITEIPRTRFELVPSRGPGTIHVTTVAAALPVGSFDWLWLWVRIHAIDGPWSAGRWVIEASPIAGPAAVALVIDPATAAPSVLVASGRNLGRSLGLRLVGTRAGAIVGDVHAELSGGLYGCAS